MAEHKHPVAKHHAAAEKPAEPVKLVPPPGPPRGHDDIHEIALLDVAVPPRTASASGVAAPNVSLNDALRYWHLIETVLEAIHTETADVKFRFTAPSGKKKNGRFTITDV